MAQRLPPQSNVSASVRTAIVVVGVLLLALPGTAQRRETDVDTDLRRFHEAAGDRGVWIDARGRRRSMRRGCWPDCATLRRTDSSPVNTGSMSSAGRPWPWTPANRSPPSPRRRLTLD